MLARILIPVANPATAADLVALGSWLGAGQPPAELVALKIVTAPRGMPLDEARRFILSMRESYEGALAQARAFAARQQIALRAELEVAQAVAPGILAYADALDALDLILLGWRGAVSLRRMRRSINQEILARARTDVAVLRSRELGSLRHILVPMSAGVHARRGLRLAERLAKNAGAEVTVLRVLPAGGEVDWEGEREALTETIGQEAPSLRYGTEQRLVRARDSVPAILAEACRQPCDLIIIGASEEHSLQHWFFGAVPDRVAERAPCSVLLVHRAEAG